MILDARNLEEVPASIAGDTVIIGAGTVGLFLAISLARANKPVILVESGGRIADTGRNGETAESLGRRHNGVLLGRAAGLGGTSVLWGGQLAEFEGADLIREGTEWPLTYIELRRWYDNVYDTLGITRRLPINPTLGGKTDAHPSIERFFTFWLPQANFATLFRDDLVSNSLIRVLLHATVNNIDFEDDRARAIWAVSSSGRRIRVAGDNFVFAGGTIANNRFFLTSQRIAAVPWKFNNSIGRYFQDHLIGKIADVDILNESRLRDLFENGIINKIKLQPKLRFTPGMRRQVAAGVCGFFSFDSRIGENVAKIKGLTRAVKSGTSFSELHSLPNDLWTLGRAFGPLLLRYVRDRRVRAFFDRALEFHVQAEQVPLHHSHIHLLGDTLGPDGLFRAGVDWQVDGCEIEAILKFGTEADLYLRTLGVAGLRIDPRLQQSAPAFLDVLNDNAHQCGGLRMAAAKCGGVTDPECRVWDTKNVYVAGASVFPTSSHANCTLTALALTARLAAMLRAGQ
jgi:choline dehydrogenase-like flavoprotein